MQKLMGDLANLEVERFTGSWNQRYRENMQKLKSGDLYEVARVIKGLLHRESERGLSTGEKYDDLEHQVDQAVVGGSEE